MDGCVEGGAGGAGFSFGLDSSLSRDMDIFFPAPTFGTLAVPVSGRLPFASFSFTAAEEDEEAAVDRAFDRLELDSLGEDGTVSCLGRDVLGTAGLMFVFWLGWNL